MKYAVLLCLTVTAFAQDLPATSPLESFFRTVVSRQSIIGTPAANTVAAVPIQTTLGFTDSEMQSLNAIARAFVARASSIRYPSSEFVFQARLELAETGKQSETFQQRMNQMNAELTEAITQATRELRDALGDDRYEKFDSWLRAGGVKELKGCLLTPCAAVPQKR